jgi:hypothetical protein
LAWFGVASSGERPEGATHHDRRGRRVAMRGEAEIINLLNEQLTSELTAVNQYFLHSKMQVSGSCEPSGGSLKQESHITFFAD